MTLPGCTEVLNINRDILNVTLPGCTEVLNINRGILNVARQDVLKC